MEVILHCGAHRCATTSFQNYLSNNAKALKRDGVFYWGPRRTRRNGLNSLNNLTPEVCSGLRREMDICQRKGATHLLVSQENFVGSMGRNVKFASLYPTMRDRAQWLARAFDGRVTKLALSIRSLDMYWTSVAAYRYKREGEFIEPARWRRIVRDNRSWRHVITDLNSAFPGIPLLVLPFEDFAGHQRAQLTALTGRAAPEDSDGLASNGAPVSAPNGLSVKQAMKLWARYADDLAWLAAGADGLAQLISYSKPNDRGDADGVSHTEQRTHL